MQCAFSVFTRMRRRFHVCILPFRGTCSHADFLRTVAALAPAPVALRQFGKRGHFADVRMKPTEKRLLVLARSIPKTIYEAPKTDE